VVATHSRLRDDCGQRLDGAPATQSHRCGTSLAGPCGGVGLVLYAASARDPQAPPDFFDGLQLLLVASALMVDGVALAAIAARISEFGFTANRVAALGENLILLVNLVWTAWLYARFVRNRGSFAALERWQIEYLPVYSVWAALVVVIFPPVFGYQ